MYGIKSNFHVIKRKSLIFHSSSTCIEYLKVERTDKDLQVQLFWCAILAKINI